MGRSAQGVQRSAYVYTNFVFTTFQIDFDFLTVGNSLLNIAGRHGIKAPLSTTGMQTTTECPDPGLLNRSFIYGSPPVDTAFTLNTTAIPGTGVFSWQARGGVDGTLFNLLKDFGYTSGVGYPPSAPLEVDFNIRFTYNNAGREITAYTTVKTYYVCTANVEGRATLTPPP